MTNKERDEFIAEQLNKGVSLSDVQSALAKDFNIKMTYFELRMVAMGLDVDWEKQDKQVQKPKADAAGPAHAEESDEEFEDEEEDEKDVRTMPDFVRKSAANKPLDDEDEEDDEAAVTIDEVPLAGSQLSGKVKFASGASGIWFLGPRGLGYDLDEGSEEPNDEDVEIFQKQLQDAVRKYQEQLKREEEASPTTVEIDKVMRPGVQLSGSVAFASGATAKWEVGARGLQVIPDDDSEKPTQKDIIFFQRELQKHLSGQA